jgi:hypothetical protein
MVVSKISEVALTVETTTSIIIIVGEATTGRLEPDPNSTHKSSRLSFAVTLCSREPALRPNHVFSLTENMSWGKSLTPFLLMPTLKLLLYSRTIRVYSKTSMDNPEVEVANNIITIRTIILEAVISKITTIKITEEATLIREAEVAIIKADTSRNLTAIKHLPIMQTMAESRTLRQLNARTLKWEVASMAHNAPSLMETRNWKRPNPRDLLKHPNLSHRIPNKLMWLPHMPPLLKTLNQ